MTAEDPVEFYIPGINQVQVKEEIGLTFATCLRTFLRQDPDIMLVGEMRDFETVDIAIKAALTGHLVFSTVHTNDAASTIMRLINMNIEPFLIADSVILIAAQRLVRRLCKKCAQPHKLPEKALLEMGFEKDELKGLNVLKPKGCDACNNTGYKGRTALYEVMPVNDDIREMILNRAQSREIKKKAIEKGMITLRRSGLVKIKNGVTSVEEVLRETVRDELTARAGRPRRTTWRNRSRNSSRPASTPTRATSTSRPTSRRGSASTASLKSIDHPPLTPTETKELVYSILTDKQKKMFEEKWELDFSFGIKELGRFRANVFMQKGAVAAAFRRFLPSMWSFAQLGIPQRVAQLCYLPRGLVLVTGPTGCGKSTTLACMIEHINRERDVHIVTIEDPIEYFFTPRKAIINQRELYVDTQSYGNALRSVLREDPDVVLVGEMRDYETVEATLRVAETGHLTFSTLHTNSAVESITRIIDIFPAQYQSQVRIMLSMSPRGRPDPGPPAPGRRHGPRPGHGDPHPELRPSGTSSARTRSTRSTRPCRWARKSSGCRPSTSPWPASTSGS